MTRRRKSSLAGTLLLYSALAGAAGLRSPGIEPGALQGRLAEPQPPLVVDVRSPDEYSSGHIPGAVSIPAPLVTRHLDEIRQAPGVVLYCNDQRFTAVAEDLLRRAKAPGISHLEGGLTAWRQLGLPLETSLPE